MNEVPYTLDEIKAKALIIERVLEQCTVLATTAYAVVDNAIVFPHKHMLERKYDASLGEPVDVVPGADYATRLMSELIDEISVVFDRIAAVLGGDFVTPAPQGNLFEAAAGTFNNETRKMPSLAEAAHQGLYDQIKNAPANRMTRGEIHD